MWWGRYDTSLLDLNHNVQVQPSLCQFLCIGRYGPSAGATLTATKWTICDVIGSGHGVISGLKGKFKNVKSNVNYTKGLVPEQKVNITLEA